MSWTRRITPTMYCSDCFLFQRVGFKSPNNLKKASGPATMSAPVLSANTATSPSLTARRRTTPPSLSPLTKPIVPCPSVETTQSRCLPAAPLPLLPCRLRSSRFLFRVFRDAPIRKRMTDYGQAHITGSMMCFRLRNFYCTLIPYWKKYLPHLSSAFYCCFQWAVITSCASRSLCSARYSLKAKIECLTSRGLYNSIGTLSMGVSSVFF